MQVPRGVALGALSGIHRPWRPFYAPPYFFRGLLFFPSTVRDFDAKFRLSISYTVPPPIDNQNPAGSGRPNTKKMKRKAVGAVKGRHVPEASPILAVGATKRAGVEEQPRYKILGACGIEAGCERAKRKNQ